MGMPARKIKRLTTRIKGKPVEEGGRTELEVCALFDHFLMFCDELKKKGSHSPTSWRPLAAADSPRSSATAAPPTSPSSPSGSTAAGSSTVPPEPSPTGPESPSEASVPTSTTSGP